MNLQASVCLPGVISRQAALIGLLIVVVCVEIVKPKHALDTKGLDKAWTSLRHSPVSTEKLKQTY